MPTDEKITAGYGRMLELFAAICSEPDNLELARQADDELTQLDELINMHS